jgi:hypothetical protein
MPHEMLGFIDAAGNYHRTPFRDAYEHGGIYTFDEVDRSDPVALLAVNPHLANGVATFPDGQIKRHKDCLIVSPTPRTPCPIPPPGVPPSLRRGRTAAQTSGLPVQSASGVRAGTRSSDLRAWTPSPVT